MSFKYDIEDFKKPGLLQKTFGKEPRENTLLELKSLLNEKGIINVTGQDISNICNKYKVNLSKQYNQGLLSLYIQFLEFCVNDKVIDEVEMTALRHLKNLFGLNDEQVFNAYKDTISKIFKEDLDSVLKDGKLSKEEDEYLVRIKNELRIPDTLFTELYSDKANSKIMEYLEETLSDEQLSPKEEEHLFELAKNMGIKLELDDKSKATLEKYKLYWQVQNAEIPVLKVDINLNKGEDCHFRTGINWLETRRITKRINYGGPMVSFRIAKGVYWRAGSLNVQRISNDVLTHIDTGMLYLTNKRIIFMGSKCSKNIQLKKILDFNVYQNGFEIVKDTGKSPFLNFESNLDYFNMILSRLLDEI